MHNTGEGSVKARCRWVVENPGQRIFIDSTLDGESLVSNTIEAIQRDSGGQLAAVKEMTIGLEGECNVLQLNSRSLQQLVQLESVV